MYIFAFILLVAAFLTAIFGSGAAAAQIWQKQNQGVGLVEKAAVAVTSLMGASSFILLAALVNNDFSLEYVAGHSDRLLPLFYRLTVFWAGQEGSILFWALSTSLFGLFFLTSGGYARLLPATRLWFWMLFLAVQGFFLLIITGWSNPFITLSPAPEDGQGLNPLLQNPGMIFHPPLLFIGYAGFAVPGCLALAQANSGGHTVEDPPLAHCHGLSAYLCAGKEAGAATPPEYLPDGPDLHLRLSGHLHSTQRGGAVRARLPRRRGRRPPALLYSLEPGRYPGQRRSRTLSTSARPSAG